MKSRRPGSASTSTDNASEEHSGREMRARPSSGARANVLVTLEDTDGRGFILPLLSPSGEQTNALIDSGADYSSIAAQEATRINLVRNPHVTNVYAVTD